MAQATSLQCPSAGRSVVLHNSDCLPYAVFFMDALEGGAGVARSPNEIKKA